MSLDWINFFAILCTQFLVFSAMAYLTRKWSRAKHILIQGLAIGLFFGLSFDFTFGKSLAVYSYALGFGFGFLVLNALFSFGLFAATIISIKDLESTRFLFMISALIIVYEIANQFFRVWTWEFSLPSAIVPVVLLAGYSIGAFLIVAASNFFLREGNRRGQSGCEYLRR